METLLLFLLCLIPVVLYCLFFAWINGRDRSLVASGDWDFVGILAAASVFIVLGGPTILSGVGDQIQMFLVSGSRRPPAFLVNNIWVLFRIVYFTVVVCGSLYVLKKRSRLTLIYNVDPDSFATALETIFRNCHIASKSINGQLILHSSPIGNSLDEKDGLLEHTADSLKAHQAEKVGMLTQTTGELAQGAAAESSSFLMRSSSNAPAYETALGLGIEASTALKCVTLTWSPAKHYLREKIENELVTSARELTPRSNAVGLWLLCISCGLIVAIFAGGAMATVGYFLGR